MNKLLLITLALLVAPIYSQTRINGRRDVVATGWIAQEIPNEAVTGTTANKLAKLTGAPSTAIIATTSDTSGVLGIVSPTGGQCTAGTTGNACIAIIGQLACVFDATAITSGDFVQVSTTTGGTCHDAGATKPTNGFQIIGRAMASAAGSSTVVVNVDPDVGGYSSTTVTHSIGAGFDGGGVALTAGKTVYFTVPYACTIQAWNMTVDTGTATIDVWKIATGTAIPTVSNTITASAVPAISTGTAVHSTSMSGWTTSVSANDIFGINLKIVATATQASLVLQCQ